MGEFKMRVFFFTLLLFSIGCKEVLLQDLAQKEATIALFNLHYAGISANKSRTTSGWSILVDNEQIPQATVVLTRAGLLRQKRTSVLAQQKRFLLSRSERAHIMELSIASRIEETLEALPGVLDARVHLFLHMQESISLKDPKRSASASAVLVVTSGLSVSKESITQIIQGAASIPSAKIEVVLVLDERFNEKAPISSPLQTFQNASKTHLTFSLNSERLYYIIAGMLGLFSAVVILIAKKRRRKQFVERMKLVENQDGELDNFPKGTGLFSSLEQKEEVIQ